MGDFQTHAVAIAPARQLALDRAQQIIDLFFVHIEIGVARHTELIAAACVHAGKQIPHVFVDDRGQKHEVVGPAVGLARGQLNHPRQRPRRLDHGVRDLAPEGIGPIQIHDEVQRLVQNARKRVGRVQPDGTDDRQQFFFEIAPQPGALVGLPLGAAQKPDILGLQRRDQRVVERLILLVDQRMCARRYRAKQFARRARIGIGRRIRQLGFLLEPSHPDLEELVEIGRRDTQEFKPLEQRHAGIDSLFEHAVVELQQRQLAVDEQLGRVERARVR